MVERRPILDFFTHLTLLVGVAVVVFPVFVALIGSTQTAEQIASSNPLSLVPGSHFFENYKLALLGGKVSGGSTIFVTLMLPVEVRISPTYAVVSDLKMLNSYAGLTVPLIASATATFLFRQFFLTVPDELVEAARMDGAGPMRFFFDVLLPLSRTSIAALFVIQFIYGWNQYLWPLLVTTSEDMYPIVLGIKRAIFGEVYVEWNVVMATAILAMLPPALVVILMQKWFVKGLVDTEK